jgi:hypothetical protein
VAHHRSPLLHGRTPALICPRLLLLLTVALATNFVLLRPPLTAVTAASTATQPLFKLPKPMVLFISSDGFRYGYQYKVPLTHIRGLITGTSTGVLIITSFVARDGKGIVAVPYFAAASRIARHGGRHPLVSHLTCYKRMFQVFQGVSYACCKCFM